MPVEQLEHVDVLIIGAGLSGVGAACWLQRSAPEKSFAILESRTAIGGTWDLFRYPGIRSDSDMFTLGYSFRPWLEENAIADGASILSYVRATASEHGLEQRIRFGQRAVRAEWSSAEARWTVHVRREETGESAPDVHRGEAGQSMRVSCSFLYCCTGYYRYEEGYAPTFPGAERFTGEIVHPQHWPGEMDYADKRVLVIGSGATAMTLVPAMAERARHVTMLQRSPGYVVSLPRRDPIAAMLRRVLPVSGAYAAVRWKNAALALASFQLSRRAPRLMRKLIRGALVKQLPEGFDADTHFSPAYNPWQQRLCVVPDGDLFKAVSDGRASIVTDRIETFTESGLKLASGAELEADIIVTATGLSMLALGGLEFALDGTPLEIASTVGYKGMMLSGVPNMALTLGYTNASWTLKADLVAGYVCRLLRYMDENGYSACTPQAPDPSEPTEPFIDLRSGYVLRALDSLPRQGTTAPWRLHQNYFRDLHLLKRGPVEDHMSFSRTAVRADGARVEHGRVEDGRVEDGRADDARSSADPASALSTARPTIVHDPPRAERVLG